MLHIPSKIIKTQEERISPAKSDTQKVYHDTRIELSQYNGYKVGDRADFPIFDNFQTQKQIVRNGTIRKIWFDRKQKKVYIDITYETSVSSCLGFADESTL